MKIKAKLASIFVTAGFVVFLSLPAFARPAGRPQDQGTAETQSVKKDKKQKAERSPGKEIGKGGEDVGKGTGKGIGKLGKKIFGRGSHNKKESDVE